MPQYDYTCGEHVYTETRSINEDQQITVCPEMGCGKSLNRIWQATPTVFSGKGFYSTDKNELLKPGQVVDY